MKQEQSDTELLGEVPDFFQLPLTLKATPQQEGDRRFIFLEASNEDVDRDNEVILQKALVKSADYYLRYGNIDLHHYSLLGPSQGIRNFNDYEIGRPLEVKVDGTRTFVKGELYRGESPQAKNADMVWDSITKQEPPMRWYPSIGGSVLHKSIKVHPETKKRLAVVEGVRWNNIALDRCPVNKSVPTASTLPIGVFAKALGGVVFNKGLSAGYGTDAAALTGGAALRGQSLEGKLQSYWDFRESLAGDLRRGRVNQKSDAMVEHAIKSYQLSPARSSEWVTRFMADIFHSLKNTQRAS